MQNCWRKQHEVHSALETARGYRVGNRKLVRRFAPNVSAPNGFNGFIQHTYTSLIAKNVVQRILQSMKDNRARQ